MEQWAWLDDFCKWSGLRRGVNHGDNQFMYPNYGSLGNIHNFSNGQGNWNMRSWNNSNTNLPWTTSTYNPSAAKLITNNGTRAENIPGNRQLPQQLHDNVAENDNGTSIGEGNVSHMEDDGLSDLFKMLDEMYLLTEGSQIQKNFIYIKQIYKNYEECKVSTIFIVKSDGTYEITM
ncbi:hypothetical protein JHK87_025096 [Glycine soja]|nr:hypothetical protein JHK87_025096 [Glycine soja]